MIRIERDPEFWTAVATHPDVSHALFGETPNFDWVRDERIYPVASAHGGYIFMKLDPFGRIWDLHSLFTPEGWGREAFESGIAALQMLPDWQLITTYQTEHAQSKPPRSFGFREAGDFVDTPYGPWKTWILTRSAWALSPAFQREARKCPSHSL